MATIVATPHSGYSPYVTITGISDAQHWTIYVSTNFSIPNNFGIIGTPQTGPGEYTLIHNLTGLLPGTIVTYYYRFHNDDTGIYIDTGPISVIAVQRPSSFSWAYPPIQQKEFKIYASDWTNMQNKINELYQYYYNTNWIFTSIIAGKTLISANIYNEIVGALNGLLRKIPVGTALDTVTANSILYPINKASLYTDLSDRLNLLISNAV